jgi:hypothetical protein
MKAAENREIPAVQRQNGTDSCMAISRGQKRIEQSLATQPMLPQPFKEQFGSLFSGEDLVNFTCSPPLLGQPMSLAHYQRSLKAALICGNVDKLCENLGSKREAISSGYQLRYPGTDRVMIGMFNQLGGNKKARVDAVIHFRPSSISPSKSFSGKKGRKMRPMLTGAISSTPWSGARITFRISSVTRCTSAANSSAFRFGSAASISDSVLMTISLPQSQPKGKSEPAKYSLPFPSPDFR